MNLSSSIIFILIILIYCQLRLSLLLRTHSFITSKKLHQHHRHHHYLYYKKTLNRYNYNNYHLYSNNNNNINQLDGFDSSAISNKNSISTKITNFLNIFFKSKKTTEKMINKEVEKIDEEAEKSKDSAKNGDNVMVCNYLNYIIIIFIFLGCIIIFILI